MYVHMYNYNKLYFLCHHNLDNAIPKYLIVLALLITFVSMHHLKNRDRYCNLCVHVVSRVLCGIVE